MINIANDREIENAERELTILAHMLENILLYFDLRRDKKGRKMKIDILGLEGRQKAKVAFILFIITMLLSRSSLLKSPYRTITSVLGLAMNDDWDLLNEPFS